MIIIINNKKKGIGKLMKKVINIICIILGCIFLVIGAIGVIIPVLPTTPFLLLTVILYAKGSERFHRWFLSTKLYKKYIEDFITTKAMTKKEKIKALSAFTILLTISILIVPIWHAKVCILVIMIGHYVYFIRKIKTVTEEEKQLLKEAIRIGEKKYVS